jgi:ribosomal protein S18 acetylase RimI-like enzyme
MVTQEITVRAATDDDLPVCLQLDLSYETDYAWQMDVRDEGGAIRVGFQTVRLPRLMRVLYPRDPESLVQQWSRRAVTGDCILVSEVSGGVRGYLVMRADYGHATGWITDLAVGRAWRRQKLGSALLADAYTWAHEHALRRLTVETQTKNYPAINFCQRHGLTFCGFNDQYFPNYDIAVFFTRTIRDGA